MAEETTAATRYTIGKLAEAAATTPRTIRYYTTERLLPPPLSEGRVALYTEAHRNRLRLIQRLKNAFLPLDAIRNQIADLTDAQVKSLLVGGADAPEDGAQGETETPLQIQAAEPHSERSSAEYVAQLLAVSGQTEAGKAASPKSKRALLVSPVFRPEEPEAGGGAVREGREIWERILLTNGAELHVRLPIETAERELLEQRLAAAQAIFAAKSEKEIESVIRFARSVGHPHPCNFRLHRRLDRGWGEMAFEYRWDSTSGLKAEDELSAPDLAHCSLYEMTRYAATNTGNVGAWRDGYFYPPDPPFPDWKFRDPTDGRSGPVGLECFPASQGWAWDRHTRRGRLVIPPERGEYAIRAVQSYRFQCAICGLDAPVPGPDAGPHELRRIFAPAEKRGVWRYTFGKHWYLAWMEIDAAGYVADSAAIGFGPDAYFESSGEITSSL